VLNSLVDAVNAMPPFHSALGARGVVLAPVSSPPRKVNRNDRILERGSRSYGIVNDG